MLCGRRPVARQSQKESKRQNSVSYEARQLNVEASEARQKAQPLLLGGEKPSDVTVRWDELQPSGTFLFS